MILFWILRSTSGYLFIFSSTEGFSILVSPQPKGMLVSLELPFLLTGDRFGFGSLESLKPISILLAPSLSALLSLPSGVGPRPCSPDNPIRRLNFVSCVCLCDFIYLVISKEILKLVFTGICCSIPIFFSAALILSPKSTTPSEKTRQTSETPVFWRQSYLLLLYN